MDPALLQRWPLSEFSRTVSVRPHLWHLQDTGSQDDATKPVILLTHGTGASTHSWREIIPLLAKKYRVVAVDLPGHGFTRMGTRMRSSLETVAEDLSQLLEHEALSPVAFIGHSAGAAVALRMAQKRFPDAKVVGINPALQPFQGLAGVMFPVAARMMAMTPGAIGVIARGFENPSRVLSLLKGTGSEIPTINMNHYATLFRDRAHIDGTLNMLAQWVLDGLLADLPNIDAETLFITGSRDRMVPPVSAVEAAQKMSNATVNSIDGCGHLVHEEAPELVARRIMHFLASE